MTNDDKSFWLVEALHRRTYRTMAVGVFTTHEGAETMIAEMKQRSDRYQLWASWIERDPDVVAVAEAIRWKMRPEDE